LFGELDRGLSRLGRRRKQAVKRGSKTYSEKALGFDNHALHMKKQANMKIIDLRNDRGLELMLSMQTDINQS
jgi:hypothetical protein